MEELFVPYVESLALKELGFNEACLGAFRLENKRFIDSNEIKYLVENANHVVLIYSPLYQQAFKWFADKYSMYRSIDALFNKGGFRAIIVNTIEHNIVVIDDRFDTYEEAELECLRKLIEIVKSKN